MSHLSKKILERYAVRTTHDARDAGASVARIANSQDFSIDLRKLSRPVHLGGALYLRTIEGGLEQDVVLVKRCVLELNEAEFLETLSEQVRRVAKSNVEFNLRYLGVEAGFWLFISESKSAGHIAGLKINLSKFGSTLMCHLADGLKFAHKPSVSLHMLAGGVQHAVQGKAQASMSSSRLSLEALVAEGMRLVAGDQFDQQAYQLSPEMEYAFAAGDREIPIALSIASGSFEARLAEQQFPDLFVNQQSDDAIARRGHAMQQALEKFPESAYLNSLAILCDVAPKIDALKIPALLENRFDYLLCSHLISSNERDGLKASDLRRWLDHLTRNLEKSVGSIEDLPALNVQLSLSYADLWLSDDVSMSLLALQKLAQDGLMERGIFDRVVKTLDYLERSQDKLRWLNIFKDLAKDHRLLAMIQIRIAGLRVYDSPNEARDLILKALSSSDADADVLLASSDMLMLNKQWQEAFSVLVNALEMIPNTHELRPQFELRLAQVYYHGFAHLDLALQHLREVRKAQPNNLEAIRLVNQIYRQKGDKESLAATLDVELKILNDSGYDKAELKKLSSELANIYRDDLQDLGKAFSLYLSQPDLVEINPEAMIRAMNLSRQSINWKNWYKDLSATLPMLSDNDQRAKLHVCLALIARDKMLKPADAIKHLSSAVEIGWIDPQSFTYLREHLAAAKKHHALHDILKHRLAKVRSDSRSELIHEILSIPVRIDDELCDDLAVEVLLEQGDEREIVRRLDAYAEHAEVNAITRLMQRIIKSDCPVESLHALIDITIDVLNRMNTPARFDLLASLYREKMRFEGDTEVTVSEAVNALKLASDQSLLLPFVSEALQNNKLPDIDVNAARGMLQSDPRAFAKFLELSASKKSDQGVAVQCLSEAISIYQAQSGTKKDLERVLLQLGSLAELSFEQRNKVEQLVKQSSNWHGLASMLKIQVNLQRDGKERYEIYQSLINIYQDRIRNLDAVIEYYRKSFEYSDDIAAHRYEFILFLIDENLVDQERSELLLYIEDESCVRQVAKLGVILDRLVSTHDEASTAFARLHAWVAFFSENNQFELAGQVADLLIARGELSSELARISLHCALIYQDADLSIERFVRLVNLCAKVDDLKVLIADVAKMIGEARSDIALDGILVSSVRDLSELHVSEEVQAALFSHIVKHLHSSDEYAEDMIKVVSMLPEATLKADTSLWIPIYLLLRDYGDGAMLSKHLRVIIPLLKNNPAPMRSLPFTIESMEAELARLSKPKSVTKTEVPPKVQVGKKSATKIEAPPKDTLASAKPAPAEEPEPAPAPNPAPVKVPIIQHDEETKAKKSDDLAASTQHSIAREWRGMVRVGNVSARAALQVNSEKFATPLEKHIVLQLFALMTREVDILMEWPWKVWRYPEQLGYPLEGRTRYPNDYSSKGLHSKLHRFLLAIAKDLATYFQERFKLSTLQDELKMTPEAFQKVVKKVEWSDYIVRSSNLIHILELLQRRKIQLFHVPGLKSRIFFAGDARSVYLDAEHYRLQPQSHLFHRLYGVLWAAKLGYLALLQLDAESEIFPFLQKLRGVASDDPLAKAKNILKSAFDGREVILSDLLTEERKKSLGELGEVTLEQVKTLQTEMNRHVHRLLLAETLDLFGLAEAITDKDLLIEDYDPKQLLESSEDLKRLIEFSLALKI